VSLWSPCGDGAVLSLPRFSSGQAQGCRAQSYGAKQLRLALEARNSRDQGEHEGDKAGHLPQEGEEAARVAPAAAARQEKKKKRTPQVDWAGLLRRTFAQEVFA